MRPTVAPKGLLSANCGPTIPDDSFVVDRDTKGIENIAIYLRKKELSVQIGSRQQTDLGPIPVAFPE